MDERFSKLPDDFEIPVSEEEKIRLADLKGALSQQEAALAERDRKLAEYAAELERLRKVAEGSASIFQEAAKLASQPLPEETGPVQNAPRQPTDPLEADPFYQSLENRLVQKLQENLLKPFVEKEVKPALTNFQQLAQQTQAALAEQYLRRQYEELAREEAWPKDMTFEQAIQEAVKRGHVLTTQQGRVPNLKALHLETTMPQRQARIEEQLRKQAEEEAIKKLRQTYRLVPIPNRAATAKPGIKRVVGPTPEAVLDNALQQAEQDVELQRMLNRMSGGQ
jgi:hypothetical protein